MCVLLQAALRWPSRLVCSARPSHTVNLVGPTRPPVSLPMRALTALPAGAYLPLLDGWLHHRPTANRGHTRAFFLPLSSVHERTHMASRHLTRAYFGGREACGCRGPAEGGCTTRPYSSSASGVMPISSVQATRRRFGVLDL